MKKFGKYTLLTTSEIADFKNQSYKEGREDGKLQSTNRVKDLEKSLERKTTEVDKLKAKNQDLKEAVDVYEEQRDKVKDVIKQQLENEDTKTVLDAVKEAHDKREARLKDRENKLGDMEQGEYKKGYADGVADGVRKINEITAKDRENAMKIAMVAASSHTPVANLKELNNVHSLTAGPEDQ